MTQNGHGSLEVALTYFMTQKFTVIFGGWFDLVYDPKCHGVIRGRRDLLYDPKSQVNLCGRFDLVYDPKKVTGSLEFTVTYFMTPKVTMTFTVGLT